MKVPHLRQDLYLREIDGEAVILDCNAERMHSFNQTAACILHAIDGNRTIEDLCQLLCAHFEVSPETALEDTSRLVVELDALGLLEKRSGVEV